MDRGQSEIGYWVAPAMWNTGFASEAVGALVAANPLDNTTIFGSVFQGQSGLGAGADQCRVRILGDAEAVSVAARCQRFQRGLYLKRLR